MPLKRKVRNLSDINHQIINGEDLLADGIPRPTFSREDNDEPLEMISTSKVVIRIKQIQNSIEQAQTMLQSMESYENLVPDHTNQREKLRSIIRNLEEQLTGYLDLLNLITLSAEERSTPFDHNDDDDLSLRRHVRPCIESKIGFSPTAIEDQQFIGKKSTLLEDDDLLVDIENLRHRLQFLRECYNEKLKNSSNKPQLLTENRLKNLEHVRERLDELEQFVAYYSIDLDEQRTSDELTDHRAIFQRKSSLLSDMISPRSIPERQTYDEKLNDAENRRPFYRDDSFNRSESFSSEDTSLPRLKQSNLCASTNTSESDELNSQLREICRCLSSFIEEQKSFNRHIEQRLTSVTNCSSTQSSDPSQFQQKDLLVNLNTAYREIAVLQSEINALQSENKRLATSISFDKRTPPFVSRESLASHRLEDSSKTSFDSRSTSQQTVIHVENIHLETAPIRKERKVPSSKGKTFIIRRRPISIDDTHDPAWIKQENEYRPLGFIDTKEEEKRSRLHRHATEFHSNEYEYILLNRSLPEKFLK